MITPESGRFLGEVLAAVSATYLVLVGWPLSQKAMARHAATLHPALRFVRSSVSAGALTLTMAILLVASLLLAVFDPWAALPLAFLPLLARPLLASLRARRVLAIERQIEGWLTALGRALEAAPSLGEALAVSARMVDRPLRDELEETLNELELGTPLDRALQNLGARVGSRTLEMALATLRVGRTTGGRLPAVLASASASLREMARLEGVLRTKTAEGRTQALIISLVPLPLYIGVRVMDPAYFVPLETTPLGQVLLGGAVLLWVLAAVVARRVLAVEL